MNKIELIKALAEKTNQSQVEAKAFLEAFTDVVGDVLKNGDKITLVGFGTFAAPLGKLHLVLLGRLPCL